MKKHYSLLSCFFSIVLFASQAVAQISGGPLPGSPPADPNASFPPIYYLNPNCAAGNFPNQLFLNGINCGGAQQGLKCERYLPPSRYSRTRPASVLFCVPNAASQPQTPQPGSCPQGFSNGQQFNNNNCNGLSLNNGARCQKIPMQTKSILYCAP